MSLFIAFDLNGSLINHSPQTNEQKPRGVGTLRHQTDIIVRCHRDHRKYRQSAAQEAYKHGIARNPADTQTAFTFVLISLMLKITCT